MFKKLLSNLPYNPSLIGQVSFYAKRLHQEEKIRRLGLVFVMLAFFVQMFAFVSQPEPTLANSTNDIIPGGFRTREEAVWYCHDTNKDYGKIFAYYGVTCDMIARATTETISSTGENRLFDSLGRNQQGSIIARTGKPTNEYPVYIPGVQTLWMKNLWAWDSGASSSYRVLKITNSRGIVIRIMYDCGNIVTIHEYPPPSPPPTTPTPTPTPSPTGEAVCVSLTATQLGPLSYRFRAQTAGNEFVVNSYTFSFGDGNTDTVRTGLYAASTDYSYSREGHYTARVSISVSVQGAQGPVAKTLACQAPVSIAAAPTPVVVCTDTSRCVELSKSARNDTQNIADANGTTAAADDRITYTLSVKNIANVKVEDFVVEENVADILDYANITDFNGGALEGVIVRWPPTDLSSGETVRRRLNVRIKNPIPSTPVSASDPARFDLIMNNVYGNAVNIKLPSNVIKTTETTTQALPNTGPGESLAAAVGFTVFVSYFFARTRLFAKEMDIVRTDYATTGGY